MIVSVLAVLEMTRDFAIHPAGVFLVVVVDPGYACHRSTTCTNCGNRMGSKPTDHKYCHGRCHYPVLHILGAFEPISE